MKSISELSDRELLELNYVAQLMVYDVAQEILYGNERESILIAHHSTMLAKLEELKRQVTDRDLVESLKLS